MSTADAPIGVFDSGIGGLTVVRALMDLAPQESIIYFGDTARVPYGAKSPATIRRYSAEIADFLLQRQVKMIVVACNTASSVALDAVARAFHGPVVGVLKPGARAAVEAVKAERAQPPWRVGVIGTARTIRSGAYERAIHDIDPAVEVCSAACPLFVPLAEEGWFTHEVTMLVARTYLEPLLRQEIQSLILGCTHYPLLTQAITTAVNYKDVHLISSAQAAAQAVVDQLSALNLSAPTGKPGYHVYYASDDVEHFAAFHDRIIQEAPVRIELANVG